MTFRSKWIARKKSASSMCCIVALCSLKHCNYCNSSSDEWEGLIKNKQKPQLSNQNNSGPVKEWRSKAVTMHIHELSVCRYVTHDVDHYPKIIMTPQVLYFNKNQPFCLQKAYVMTDVRCWFSKANGNTFRCIQILNLESFIHYNIF